MINEQIIPDKEVEIMLQLDLASARKMLNVVKGHIRAKCIKCQEYIRDAVENCMAKTCRERQSKERIAQMQETLCKRCPLYPYEREMEGQKGVNSGG